MLILFCLRGWKLTKPPKNSFCKDKAIFCSIILPARNEENNISDCLLSLINQDYPKENFEVIVVNDHSTDKTAALALQTCIANFRMVNLSQ